jgi:hypothetical protein
MGSCARANQRQITLNLLDEMEVRNVSDHRSPFQARINFYHLVFVPP